MTEDTKLKQIAYAALLDAKQEIGNKVVRNAENPFHHSKYADLGAVVDAVDPVLQRHGFALVQHGTAGPTGKPYLVTKLLHAKTGIEIDGGMYPLVCAKENDPQAMGSSTTYARRYAVMALMGMSPADDDGERGSGRTNTNAGRTYTQPRQQSTTATLPPEDDIVVVDDEKGDTFEDYSHQEKPPAGASAASNNGDLDPHPDDDSPGTPKAIRDTEWGEMKWEAQRKLTGAYGLRVPTAKTNFKAEWYKEPYPGANPNDPHGFFMDICKKVWGNNSDFTKTVRDVRVFAKSVDLHLESKSRNEESRMDELKYEQSDMPSEPVPF